MKRSIKNIVIESIGLILIVFGIEKLRIAMRSEIHLAILSNDMNKFESLTSDTIGDIVIDYTLWGLWALLIGFISIGLCKFLKKNKIGLLESLISIVLVFCLFPLGFFRSGIANSIINFVGGIITENFKIKSIINGILWTIIGISTIWFTLKNTTHNKA